MGWIGGNCSKKDVANSALNMAQQISTVCHWKVTWFWRGKSNQWLGSRLMPLSPRLFVWQAWHCKLVMLIDVNCWTWLHPRMAGASQCKLWQPVCQFSSRCLVWLVCCFKRDCPEKKKWARQLDNGGGFSWCYIWGSSWYHTSKQLVSKR